MKLWLDLETFSDVNIKRTGAYPYAISASTRILLFGYAVDDAPAKVWDLTVSPTMPADLKAAVENPDTIFVAHNAQFDRTVLTAKLGRPFNDLTRWHDSMILAYSVSLPGALGDLSELLGMEADEAKDKDGRRLVLKFCKPTSAGYIHDSETDPEDWGRFVNYCRLDVEAMRAITKKIPKWNTRKLWSEWVIDQKINKRGIPIDTDLVTAAVACSAEVKAIADKEIKARTSGEVETTMQRDALLAFLLKSYGVTLPDLQKSTLERRLGDENLPQPVRDLLALRLSSSMVSVKKYEALDRATCEDGRLRGTTQFMGAARTGRFAGRIFQPQNLPRGTIKSQEEIETAIGTIKAGLLPIVYENPNAALSSCIRGAVMAKPGCELIVADLSNIEGRVLAWLAGEDWKIKAFEEYDAGVGPDLYKASYGRAFGVDPKDVTKSQRQIGKVMELAMGYQGGAAAFRTFATLYNIDLMELARHTREAADPEVWRKAVDSYGWALEHKLTEGIPKEVYLACDTIKRSWRLAHPAITALWQNTEDAAIAALETGYTQPLGRHLRVMRPAKGWLAVVLPSGRGLCYPSARTWREGEARCAFTYGGVNQYTRRWERLKTYGGKVVENITQATARDVLMEGLIHAEERGMRPVMHIHDEIVCECRTKDGFTVADLEDCMTKGISWTKGLPLNAAGFKAIRYRKD